MNRRDFLFTAAAGAAASCTGLGSDRDLLVPGLPCPRPPQLAWQRAELGVVFHYDLHLFDDTRYVQAQNRRAPIADLSIFDPRALDTDQWLAAAQAAGARFAILTASHETGFRLWPSDCNPWSVKNTPWRGGRGDLVGDFVASCRRHGIAPGIYLGARWNAHLQVLDFRVQQGGEPAQRAYNQLIEREVGEVCSRYGPLFELWFDGGVLAPRDGGPDVLPIFAAHQPDCLYYHSDERADARWGGTESGTVGDPCWATVDLPAVRTQTWNAAKMELLRHGDPNGRDWCPAMADAPLRNHEWFWEPGDEHKLYPVEHLVEMYFGSVGNNATLILGATPDRRGLVPDADFERMAQMGRAVARALGAMVATTSGRGRELTLEVPDAAPFDVIVLQEDIEFGERVRSYSVEARTGTDTWTPIATGTCIGHKHIHRVAVTTAPRLRLRIDAATATPLLTRFEVRRSGA